MGKTQEEMKLAVDSGYWPLYRYNPPWAAEGKNPFMLESKAPDGTIQAFLAGEIRFASLEKSFPEESKKLRKQLEKEVTDKYRSYQVMAGQSDNIEKKEDA